MRWAIVGDVLSILVLRGLAIPTQFKIMFNKIKPGRKTLDWNNAKRKLKPAFSAVGITYCEVGRYLLQMPEYSDIVVTHRHNFFMTWAHGDKRRNLCGNELLTLVALSCVDCHNLIEKMPSSKMREIIEGVINCRGVQPSTYYGTK